MKNENLEKCSRIQSTTSLLVTPSLNVYLLLLSFHLLIQSGDIESNPGPTGRCTSFVNKLIYCIFFVDGELKIKDLQELYTQLKPLSSKWLDFGLSLRLDYDSLSALDSKHRSDPDTSLREMLATRLKSSAPLTWSDVCSCLRAPTVRREDLAQQIESIYSGILYLKLYNLQ